MAETESYKKSQQPGSKIDATIPQNQTNPSKFYSSFLYKALIVTLFLAILPLFPSQAPEFVNQTVFNRGWELLHLLFVGIAVSYGLFSRRNDETEKENNSKFDNAQSYVSRFLQASSVFDEEVESPSGSGDIKVQTWNNQYYRGEPVVVVAPESSVLDDQRNKGSRVGEKPLLLPVRSLKSRVSDPGDGGSFARDGGTSRSLSRSSSNLGSNRTSNIPSKTQSEEFRGFDASELEKKLEPTVVLPSPIPWRSRSGRMELKEGMDSPFQYSLPSSMEQSELNKLESSKSFRSQRSPPSHSSSASSSPNKLSPSPSISSPKKLASSPSLSSESQAKSLEDYARKKSFYKSPPPPPPPPPSMIPRSPLVKTNPSATGDGIYGERDLSRSGREDKLRRTNSGVEATSIGKSVRALRAAEVGDDEKRSTEVATTMTERTRRNMGTFDQVAVSTDRPSHDLLPATSRTTFAEYDNEGKKDFSENDMLDYYEESKTDEESSEESSSNDEAASTSVADGGPDVNKKADEFIAKFREQIRLQRIESIKRSSAQFSRNFTKQI